MALNTEVFTIEGWKRFISDSIAKLYAVTTALLDIYNRAKSAGGKDFYEINDEIISKALISGLQDDGNYSQNALALFYKDALGIYLEDPKLLVRLYQSGRKLTVKVNISEEYFWRYIVNIQRISKFIIDRFGMSVSPAKIERPRDFYDKFLEFLNLIINLLPQYNQYTFLAFTLAQNTYKYLVEISKPQNNIYPNILENKDLLHMLGITKIVEMPENEYSLWGYSDYMVYDNESSSILGLQLDNINTLRTLGGAICKLIDNIFKLWSPRLWSPMEFKYSEGISKLSKWFTNMPKEDEDLEIRYVRSALERIKDTEIEPPTNYTPFYGHEVDYNVDDDYVVRTYRYYVVGGYKLGELRNKFLLWEFLDNYSPLMFLGVLYVVFIEPVRRFRVLVRPENVPSNEAVYKKDTFVRLYNEVLGGGRA